MLNEARSQVLRSSNDENDEIILFCFIVEEQFRQGWLPLEPISFDDFIVNVDSNIISNVLFALFKIEWFGLESLLRM